MDEYSESESAPVPASGVRETPSTVRILADMRRCAYDLDFLISRQPRQTYFGVNNKSLTNTRGGSNQQQQHPSMATPNMKTPAPNELEYLDVFDFFNMPRLPPAPIGGPVGSGEVGSSNGDANGNGNGNSMPEYQSFMDYQSLEGNHGTDWLVQ